MFGKTLRILSLALALGIATPLLAHAGMYARHADSITPATATTPPLPMQAWGATLTEAEASDLVFMREEEKLARDLYITFDELWGAASSPATRCRRSTMNCSRTGSSANWPR